MTAALLFKACPAKPALGFDSDVKRFCEKENAQADRQSRMMRRRKIILLSTRVERNPQAESLLPGRALRSPERARNLASRSLLSRARLKLANVLPGPLPPLG